MIRTINQNVGAAINDERKQPYCAVLRRFSGPETRTQIPDSLSNLEHRLTRKGEVNGATSVENDLLIRTSNGRTSLWS
jgi:hypothetical protein